MPRVTLFSVLLFVFTLSANAAPIYVDIDAKGPVYNGKSWGTAYKSIVVAITSNTANEIWVKSGTYNEQVELKKYSRIYGGFLGCETATNQRIPGAFPTIIDGKDSYRGIDTIENSFVTIDGMEVRNGRANYGAGIRISDGCTAKVFNCRVTNCEASIAGGGIYFGDYAMGEMSDCFISNCKAPIGGGTVIQYHSYPTLNRNAYVKNIALEHGGGAYCPFHSGANFKNCTFSYNSAGIDGGGLYTYYGGPVKLDYCIVSHNSAPVGGGIYCGGYSSNTTVTNSNFVNNAGGDFEGVISEPLPPVVILHTDPKFLAPKDDCFNLHPSSPCPTMGAYPNEAACNLDRIGFSRLLPDGAQVEFTGKVVSLVDGGITYIQEPNRTFGIACLGLNGFARGDIIKSIGGTLATANTGQRVITINQCAPWPYAVFDMNPLGTLICNLSRNSGVYTRCWGTVESIKPNGFMLRNGDSNISVRYSGQLPLFGETISTTGIYTLSSDFTADSITKY